MPMAGQVIWPVPLHQSDVLLDQANPVQNQWYTVLDVTGQIRVYLIIAVIVTTGETLGIRITVDGVVLSGATACAASTAMCVRPTQWAGVANEMLFSASMANVMLNPPLEGRSVKVEIRKTTNNGAGNLQCRVIWARWP